MQTISPSDFAHARRDQIIAERFARVYGITTYDALCDRIDRRSTAHLNDHLAKQVRDTAGRQRRRAKFKIENAATLIIAIPVRDPRTDTDVWVETEFGIWLDVIESRADGAWKLDYKGSDQPTGQVRTKVPLQGRSSAANTAVARIIVNAKAGQQARRHDRNPLNLRRDNLFLLGDPGTAEGKAGNAKTDTRALFRIHGDAREALAGQDYGVPLEC